MVRRLIAPLVAQALTSPALRSANRAAQAAGRRLKGARPLVRYFHDPADPYSHLAAQLLQPLITTYPGVRFAGHLVSPPGAGAAPEAEKLKAYARRDAALLARAHGLSFPEGAGAPDPAAVSAAAGALAGGMEANAFAATAIKTGERLWNGMPVSGPPAPSDAFAAGDALRAKLGHYLGATFHFEGEWYWGVDRLPYLEERLAFARRTPQPVTRFLNEGGGPRVDLAGRVSLDFFLSFRSPYTYIAAERVFALVRRHKAALRLRFVLPMVMRGLPVPPPKRLYIVRDTKREAERRGFPFGRIADPVGAGAERGLAVLHHAVRAGKGEAFASAFLKGVFAEGVNAATDRGLLRLAERAGLSQGEVEAALADPGWRAVAEANREELFALGLWGVPSFRVGARAPHWGQDRLWAIENELRAEAAARLPMEA